MRITITARLWLLAAAGILGILTMALSAYATGLDAARGARDSGAPARAATELRQVVTAQEMLRGDVEVAVLADQTASGAVDALTRARLGPDGQELPLGYRAQVGLHAGALLEAVDRAVAGPGARIAARDYARLRPRFVSYVDLARTIANAPPTEIAQMAARWSAFTSLATQLRDITTSAADALDHRRAVAESARVLRSGRLRLLTGACALASVVIVVGSAVFAVVAVRRPLRQIQEGFRRIAAGDLTVRLTPPPDRPDVPDGRPPEHAGNEFAGNEFDGLARSVDATLNRLHTAFSALAECTDHLAHSVGGLRIASGELTGSAEQVSDQARVAATDAERSAERLRDLEAVAEAVVAHARALDAAATAAGDAARRVTGGVAEAAASVATAEADRAVAELEAVSTGLGDMAGRQETIARSARDQLEAGTRLIERTRGAASDARELAGCVAEVAAAAEAAVSSAARGQAAVADLEDGVRRTRKVVTGYLA